MRRLVWLLIGLALTAQARAEGPVQAPVQSPAQDRPLLLPARDVDVTYDLAGPKSVLHQRMRWSVADRLERVDPPVAGIYMILNYGDATMSVVRPQDRSVMRLSGIAGLAAGQGGGAFVRLADATVANLPCTEWRTTAISGEAAEICMTADGVLLRARSGDQVLLQASRVTYAPQPPALFQPPAEFRLLSPPQ